MARIRRTISKTKRHQVFLVKFYWLIIIIVFLAAFLIEYFFILKPKLDQVASGGPLDIQSRQNILAEQEAYLKRLEELKAEADEINRAELEKLNYVLAQKVEIPDILNQINVLAQQSGLTLTRFDFDFGQGVVTLNLNFKDGTYQIIKQYLEMIEKNIRIMDVTHLDIKNVGNLLSLTIQSYYLE